MELKDAIMQKILVDPYNVEAYEDLLSLCAQMNDHYDDNEWLREQINKNIAQCGDIVRMFSVYERSLLLDARDRLDCYLLYLELNREPEQRFYEPRRKILKRVVDSLQRLADDELDELFLSMPPRVGKTTLMIFFMTWVIGRDIEHPNLYCSYSDVITRSFYNGVMEVLEDSDTYRWNAVFPNTRIATTNMKDETLDIGRKKHYPSLTCRSIDGTINGACDAESGFIIADDLISGIEEALNKSRLESKWNKVDNNLIPRGKGRTKYLWIGTRWSVFDPAGVRMELLRNDKKFQLQRYDIINLPALDANDESNFDYPYGVGFNTLYYHQRRASFERNNDVASWLAQYQGEPIEREGTLFAPADLRYYNGVLPENVDRVFMSIDPAFGGGDFVAATVCVQCGDDIFVPDVVYDNNDKRVTIPLLVNAIKKHNVTWVQVEATKATRSYAQELDEALKEALHRINITTKAAPSTTTKDQRIYNMAPNLRESFVFLENGHRSREYTRFMENVFSWKMYAKNKHDDAPDSLAMAAEMAFSRIQRAEVFRRMF